MIVFVKPPETKDTLLVMQSKQQLFHHTIPLPLLQAKQAALTQFCK
jgi:hypothetical protein